MKSAQQFCVLLVASVLAACSGGDTQTPIPCSNEELWDHVAEECVPRYRDSTGTPDVGEEDADVGVDLGAPQEDVGTDDVDMAPPIGDECDKDRDGVASIECGGLDCDDNDILRSPNVPELCDLVDNDCDGVNNEGLNCTFFAHSGSTVYSIDPFKKELFELSTDAPNLLDIDTHPNGTLLGVTFEGLVEYDEIRNNWFFVGEFNRAVGDPNGLAIDSAGTAFVTSQDKIFTVDLIDGSATLLGTLGANYYSSGDCVVNKRDSLFVTSKHDMTQDHLLLVNRGDGSASEVGPIGFQKVFALTAAWGTLYGLTSAGELIEIDTTTGAGTLVHQFQGVSFYGAASTPSR